MYLPLIIFIHQDFITIPCGNLLTYVFWTFNENVWSLVFSRLTTKGNAELSEPNDLEIINQRLSSVSIAESKGGGSQRGSYMESDESDDGERENHAPRELHREDSQQSSTRKRASSVHDQNKNNLESHTVDQQIRHHRHSWVTQSVGATSDVLRKVGFNIVRAQIKDGRFEFCAILGSHMFFNIYSGSIVDPNFMRNRRVTFVK